MIRIAPGLAPGLSPTVDQRQAQGLAMSTALAQAIGMLSMAPAELRSLVAEHVERNPFLAAASRAGHEGASAIERVAAPERSHHEALREQVRIAFGAPADRALATALVAELDEAGYLREPVADLAERIGVAVPAVERVVARCRAFEPAGVFARDLADCMAMQIEARGEMDDAMRAVLDCLPALASGGAAAVAARTGLGGNVVLARLARLKRCDPKPLAGAAGPAPVIEPVARIARGANGAWVVRPLSSANPRVLVDADLAGRMGCDAQARDYVRGALAEARWLERALAQRMRSLTLVLRRLASVQAPFLERGEEALRPLSMRAVGDAVGLHESTVSRVCAGKSVEVPHGTVPLRALFGSGVAAGDGALAASAVQRRIRRLIEVERPGAILSDEALAGLLRNDGIEIARRTVAKYREAMGIGTSTARRRIARGACGSTARSRGETVA